LQARERWPEEREQSRDPWPSDGCAGRAGPQRIRDEPQAGGIGHGPWLAAAHVSTQKEGEVGPKRGFVFSRKNARSPRERLDQLDLMVVHMLAEAGVPCKHDGGVTGSNGGVERTDTRVGNDDIRPVHLFFELSAREHGNTAETGGSNGGCAYLAYTVEGPRVSQERGLHGSQHAIEGLKRVANRDK
jgi:hypothetical protein